jgi:hypothetical protein
MDVIKGSTLNVSDVYVDRQLTDISVRYSNPSYLADTLFPIISVPERTGIYFVYGKENLKVEDDLRTKGSRANRVEMSLTKATFGPLKEHSLESPIDWEIRDAAQDPIDVSTDVTILVSDKLLLRKEVDLAAYLSSTSNVTQYVTLSGTDQFSDYVNSDPFAKIEIGRLAIQKNALKVANTIFMGLDVWAVLKNHPDFLERAKYTRLGVVTTDLLKDLFPGIENIYVGEAMYNTAAEGQTASLSAVWGKNLWIAYVTPQPGLRTVSLGYTLTWGDQRKVEMWSEQEFKQDMVRVTDYYQQLIVAVECIYGIFAVVA